MTPKFLHLRAIRAAWAVARACGIEPKASVWPAVGTMSRDDQVRKAMVMAWLAGYRNGLAQTKADERAALRAWRSGA